MSYIRCTSNPEGLYSWSDIDGNVYFSIDDKLIDIKTPLFNNFFKQFLKDKYLIDCLPLCDKDDLEEVPIRMEQDGQYITVCECWVDVDTNKKITQEIIQQYQEEWAKNNYEGSIHRYGSRVELNINGSPIYLYDVTWHYMVNRIVEGLKSETVLAKITHGFRYTIYLTLKDLIVGLFKQDSR